jgi:DNA-binding LytR/AlgR family response regulator
LDGLELASLLTKLSDPPVIVFVTAHEEHAVAAFGIGAVDYLLKPLRAERLADSLARVTKRAQPAAPLDAMAALPVEAGGRTHYVRRSDVQFVEAHGDYVRLYTKTGAHLVRMPISRLQEYWESAGFARVHRGFLVALGSVRELRSDSLGGLLAHTDLGDVPVSRRHSRELRERLLRAAQRGELDRRL